MVYQKNGNRIFFDWVIRVILLLAGLITFLPFLYVVLISLLSEQEFSSRGLVIPSRPTLDNYIIFLDAGTKIWDAYAATLFITIVGTAIAVTTTAFLAYGLARRDLAGRRIINNLMVFTMFFSGGMVPTYMVVKSLGLLNTYWAIILPMAVSVWNTMLMRTFFTQLPLELEEAALMDGASDLRVALSIMFPLSKASFATIALFYAVGYWNEWYSALLYLNNKRMYPLQMALRDIIVTNTSALDVERMAMGMKSMPPSAVMKMTAIVFAVGPILLVYPFVQKYFVKGVMVGSLKG